MNNDVPFWLPGLAALAACAASPPPVLSVPASSTPAPRRTAVSLEGLSDGIEHYRNRNGADYPKYAPEQIVDIADNVLLYQRANGGWIENQGEGRPCEKQSPRTPLPNPSLADGSRFVTSSLDERTLVGLSLSSTSAWRRRSG